MRTGDNCTLFGRIRKPVPGIDHGEGPKVSSGTLQEVLVDLIGGVHIFMGAGLHLASNLGGA